MTTKTTPADWSWVGAGSTRLLPSAWYWAHLAKAFPDEPVENLKMLSEARHNEFSVGDLPPGADETLLEVLAADGWVRKEVRRACPNRQCDFEPTDEDIATGHCPRCDAPISAATAQEFVFTRDLAPTRDVDWVVVIHGMNTKGAWQEEFSWFLGTTWGKSVPVAIYKYGIIVAGVIMAWRRRTLQRRLRVKLDELRTQARSQGYGETPDVIAHSFGTWLLGHLLEDELKADVEKPLRFGRVILTGCVLRPDFRWDRIKAAGLVKEVLNHYATKDPIVPLAHWTIWDSGPSGRRGFDGDNVINIRAEGLKHSDLFSVDLCVSDGRWRQKCPSTKIKGDHPLPNTRGHRHLDHTYEKVWRPFLTLPPAELDRLPDISPPEDRWYQAAAPLRGTLFPIVAIPFLAALLVLATGSLGGMLSRIQLPVAWVAGVAGLGLIALLLGVCATLGWRRLRKANEKL